MDRHEVAQQLREFIGPYLHEQGFLLVDLIYRYEGRDLFLRILADRPEGGISIEECAGLNRQISELLDEKGIIEDKFVLEVSSPGIDYPMKAREDFLRCLNKQARFFLSRPIDGKIEYAGIVAEVDQENVFVDTQKKRVKIPLSLINKARQIIK